MQVETTDRNGWPATLDDETNTLLVTFPNGNVGRYETCHLCNGAGGVTASWGLDYFCNACQCSGRRLVEVTKPAVVAA